MVVFSFVDQFLIEFLLWKDFGCQCDLCLRRLSSVRFTLSICCVIEPLSPRVIFLRTRVTEVVGTQRALFVEGSFILNKCLVLLERSRWMDEWCVMLLKHSASELCEKGINAWSQAHISMATDAWKDMSNITQHDPYAFGLGFFFQIVGILLRCPLA